MPETIEKKGIQLAKGYSERVHSFGDWWKNIPRRGCIIVYLDDSNERNKGDLKPVRILSNEEFEDLIKEKKEKTDFHSTELANPRFAGESEISYTERMAKKVIHDLIMQYHPKGHVVVMKVLKSYITD